MRHTSLEAAMNTDIDFDLTSVQWETLKALRPAALEHGDVNRFALKQLMALGLVTELDGLPVITRKGRDVVLRGSPRLWDVAA
jgi:hypothetical protein